MRKSSRVSSPATMPPPKLLAYAHTLLPREHGVSNFNGLVAEADVAVLSPKTSSTSRCARPFAFGSVSKFASGTFMHASKTKSEQPNATDHHRQPRTSEHE